MSPKKTHHQFALPPLGFTQHIGVVQAIGRIEGFFEICTHPNRPQRNNNPGDIEWGKFAQGHGADRKELGIIARFAHFPTTEIGWSALKALLQTDGYRGKTVRQVVTMYAPPNENDTEQYIRSLCAWTGLQDSDVIDNHL